MLTEKLLDYQQQYQSYLPEGHNLSNDDLESLNNYKLHQIEKMNQRKQKSFSMASNVRRGSNSFSGGIKPAIKLNRGATAYEKKNPKSPADTNPQGNAKYKFFPDQANPTSSTNVVNFATQKRPSTFSNMSSAIDENFHLHIQDNFFKKSLSKTNSNLSYKSLSNSNSNSNSASYPNANNPRSKSFLSSASSQSYKSKSSLSQQPNSENSPSIRLTDLVFDGYSAKKEIIILEADPSVVYAETRNNKIEQEPDYVTPSFKIRKYDTKNPEELDMAKLDIYKRYAFIDNANIRAKSMLSIAPISKISTGFKRI